MDDPLMKEITHTESSSAGTGRDDSSPTERRAGGPRTKAGKRRTKFSATKDGLFARVKVLPRESVKQFEALFAGIHEEYPAETQSEREDVDHLISLYIRRRRLHAAEFGRAALANIRNIFDAEATEAWDVLRGGEAVGGILRYASNLQIITEVIEILITCRNAFEELGFDAANIPSLLTKIYGVDSNGEAPVGLCRAYIIARIATRAQAESTQNDDGKTIDPEELRSQMLKVFDQEIQNLRIREKLLFVNKAEMVEAALPAALLPSGDFMEKLIQIEAHTTREIERTSSGLKHLRRRARGTPNRRWRGSA
jgi:hypothetical protein